MNIFPLIVFVVVFISIITTNGLPTSRIIGPNLEPSLDPRSSTHEAPPHSATTSFTTASTVITLLPVLPIAAGNVQRPFASADRLYHLASNVDPDPPPTVGKAAGSDPAGGSQPPSARLAASTTRALFTAVAAYRAFKARFVRPLDEPSGTPIDDFHDDTHVLDTHTDDENKHMARNGPMKSAAVVALVVISIPVIILVIAAFFKDLPLVKRARNAVKSQFTPRPGATFPTVRPNVAQRLPQVRVVQVPLRQTDSVDPLPLYGLPPPPPPSFEEATSIAPSTVTHSRASSAIDITLPQLPLPAYTRHATLPPPLMPSSIPASLNPSERDVQLRTL